MNIVLATDDNYAIPCATCVVSILKHNVPSDCNIFVLTTKLSDKNGALFQRIGQMYNASVRVIDVNVESLKNVAATRRFPMANFLRLLAPYILKDEHKAIYMDCDVLVVDEIKSLWNLNVDNYACALCEDQNGDDITLHNAIQTDGVYYNAGVMVMNLDAWREGNITRKIVDFMAEYPERCQYPDQNAINFLLQDQILQFDYRYNLQEDLFENQSQWKLHRRKWPAIEDAKAAPHVLHYTGWCKPWMKGCTHPLRHLYGQYRSALFDNNKVIEKKRILSEEMKSGKKRTGNKHIRRANFFMILFIVETVAFVCYLLLCR